MAKSLRLALPAVPLALLAACAVGPDYHRPQLPQEDAYAAETALPAVPADDAVAFDHDRLPPDDWWKAFGSATVDSVLELAAQSSPQLQAAQASLRRSQAQLRAGYGVFYPGVSAAGGVGREKGMPQQSGEDVAGGIYSLFTLSASVSYALDVFGGERRTVEGLQAQAEQQRQGVRAARLSLQANVLNALVARAAYAEQIDATADLAAALRQQAGIAAVRAEAGVGAYADLLQLQAQLAAVEAGLPPLRQRFEQSGHLLAALCGQAAGQWTPPPIRLDELRAPATVPVGVPSTLVERRPDILAAEAQLHAASAGIGVATAAMLPSLTINGGYGRSSLAADRLFSAGSAGWSIGAAATAPLFEGGTLWYQRRAAVETFRQSEALYRQTVLDAFDQVADALRALQHDAEAQDAERRRLAAAQDALKLVQANYEGGTASYIEVLVADAASSQARLDWIGARALRLQDTVAMYAALGGGDMEAPAAGGT